ncbi:MAG: T9SS type B sorting domain-containing protein, partial [Saprospiraceae bacterium]
IAPFKPYYCQGEIVALFSPSYDTLNFPDLTFEWMPANDNSFNSPKDLLNAALTLLDTTLYIRNNINNACVSSDSILIYVVPSGVPISVSDTTLCPGEKFNVSILSTQVTDPAWDPEDGLSCSKCLNPTVTVIGTPGSSMTYQFSGKILECPVGATLNITIPQTEIINLSGDQPVCGGDTVSIFILNPEGLSDFNWSVTSGDASLSCKTCIKPVLTLNSNDGATVSVSAMTTNPNFCGAQGFLGLAHGLLVQENLEVKACLGGTVVASTTDPNYTNVVWTGNSQLSLSCTNCPNPIVTVNSAGTLRYTAESTDPDVCQVKGTVLVTIFLPDDSHILTIPDTSTHIGQGADVMATLDNIPLPASVTWTANGVAIPSTNPLITFNASNEINFLTATFINSKGCEQTDTLSFKTVPPYYKIPNAFTPDNNDELNDNFRFIITGNIVLQDFMIFNRWGQLVYKAVDNDLAGWDGRFKNEPAASDTYVYKATLRFPDGSSKLVKGDVILLR